jgi:hypothetical protein
VALVVRLGLVLRLFSLVGGKEVSSGYQLWGYGEGHPMVDGGRFKERSVLGAV